MSQDFFTRMIAVNCAGPNMTPTACASVTDVFMCGHCRELHDEYEDAQECCLDIQTKYRCGECGGIYSNKDDAGSCCHDSSSTPMRCPVCIKATSRFQDAVDCCLFNHPTMTKSGRELVAEMVAAGTPWPEAIAANIHN